VYSNGSTQHTIDVLVNNAGQTHASLVEDTPIETALRVFDTNFWGVVRSQTQSFRQCGSNDQV
jgi:short-subunit dehydrogenase